MTCHLRPAGLVLGILLAGMPAVAPAQYVWNRQQARLVTTVGELAQTPAPPAKPDYSTIQPPTGVVVDNGTNPNELVLTVSVNGPVANKSSVLHLNPSGLAKWLFYGGGSPPQEAPATDQISWASGAANTLINAGVWHHDGSHPQEPALQDCQGRWTMNGPTTAAVTGRFEYAYTASAGNASWFQYHTGQFRVRALPLNGQNDTALLDVWHQGLAGYYFYWFLEDMGGGQMYMGNSQTISFGPYGGSLAIDTVAPTGVLQNQDVALATQPDSKSNFIVLPSIEHIATTPDPNPTGSSGSAQTNWKLYFTIQGAYVPPQPPLGGGPPH